jgi:hypothetical protein
VQCLTHIRVKCLGRRHSRKLFQLHGCLLNGVLPGRSASEAQGNAQGDSMQPGRQSLLTEDGASLANEDEEGSLKGILGVLLLAKHMAADIEHQAGMTPDKQLEGCLVAGLDESAQQFGVGQPATSVRADQIEDRVQKALVDIARHGMTSR